MGRLQRRVLKEDIVLVPGTFLIVRRGILFSVHPCYISFSIAMIKRTDQSSSQEKGVVFLTCGYSSSAEKLKVAGHTVSAVRKWRGCVFIPSPEKGAHGYSFHLS